MPQSVDWALSNHRRPFFSLFRIEYFSRLNGKKIAFFVFIVRYSIVIGSISLCLISHTVIQCILYTGRSFIQNDFLVVCICFLLFFIVVSWHIFISLANVRAHISYLCKHFSIDNEHTRREDTFGLIHGNTVQCTHHTRLGRIAP